MTFTVSNKAISDALTMLSKVIAQKNILPILNDAIFQLEGNRLQLTTSDIENRMTTTVDITEGDGDGAFAVNARNMMEALRNMCDMPLTFEHDEKNGKVKVTYPNGVFTLPTEKTDEFPCPGDINTTVAITIS